MKTLVGKARKALTLRFSDKKMEKEYYSIKIQNSKRDFQATAIYLIVLMTIGVIVTVPRQQWLLAWLSISGIIFGLILLIFQQFMKNGFQFLTLLIVVYFILNRLFVILLEYDTLSKITTWYFGYLYAINQYVLLSLIPDFKIKTITIIVSLCMRIAVLIICDSIAAIPTYIIRQVFVDVFIIYMLFSTENVERRVFRNFFENRDELSKFKELLAESLPQSVIVVDLQTQRPLFANNAFLSSFCMENTTDFDLMSTENNNGTKPNFNSLRIDLSTLRESGTPQDGLARLIANLTCTSQANLLKRLAQENLINQNTLSINSFYKDDDKQRTFEVTIKRIKWNRTDAIAIILNDTTYQENLVALKLANANKDQIIATVSHELRTPLHGIIGLLDIAEKKVCDKEALSHLSLCKDNAHLLSSLVNSLLDLQQLSMGKLKLNEVRMDIAKTLKDVVQLFKFQYEAKNIHLEFEVQENVQAQIITDENRFKQILINLIGNAIKFTFNGGVQVKVSQDLEDEKCLIVSVADTGIGIKPGDIGKLFKMYGKLADSSTVNRNGVGLGLTISSSLAALLNGEKEKEGNGINVRSEYGKGSTFYFKILKDLKEFNQTKEGKEEEIKVESSRELQQTQELFYSTIADEVSDEHPLYRKMTTYEWRSREFKSSRRESKASEPTALRILKSVPEQSECILVVDDNPFNVLVAKSLLKDLGYEVKSASGGQEALDVVKLCAQERVRIKVIFLDCQMPLMDGYETARILRTMMASGEVPLTPIFAWTANTGDKEIKLCYESGMTGHLSKPTTKENVMKAIPK